ncbi:MAG: hypothetical protein GEU75_15275 [Dehalococcoidia bacterium]|nr:hypothetical protein [Dehalococcoidia bacterium]
MIRQAAAEGRLSTGQVLLDRALLVLAVASLVYLAATWAMFLLAGAPLLNDATFSLTGVGPAVVGALLVTLRPGNIVGRLLILIGSGWCLGEAGRLYLWVDVQAGPQPFSELAAWFVSWTFAVAWPLPVFLPALFPAGRTTSRWMRWLIRGAVFTAVMYTLTGMFVPAELDVYGDYLGGFSNPLGIEWLAEAEDETIAEVMFTVLSAPLALLAVLSPIDLFLRWRRSHGIERLQMRSFALGVLLAVLLLFGGLLLFAVGFPKVVENLLLVAAFNALPVSIGVAVARYRLYDLDRIISRTLVYAVLTAGLGATYFGLVVGLQALMRPISGGSDLAIVATTLIVAALFLPARRRIQNAVDRRFNRRVYDAARTVEAFGARLRQQIDFDTLRYELLAVVDETMQPARASVWLRNRNDPGTP